MFNAEELAEMYFSRAGDPYPDFGFDLQLISTLVAAMIQAAPKNAEVGNNPGTLEDHILTAMEYLGKMKCELTKLKAAHNTKQGCKF